MKAKIKSGHDLLFTQGESNNWNDLKNKMIVNFMDKWTFVNFRQVKNHLIINTSLGEVDIVFTSKTPKLEYDHEEKEQVVFNIL